MLTKSTCVQIDCDQQKEQQDQLTFYVNNMLFHWCAFISNLFQIWYYFKFNLFYRHVCKIRFFALNLPEQSENFQ